MRSSLSKAVWPPRPGPEPLLSLDLAEQGWFRVGVGVGAVGAEFCCQDGHEHPRSSGSNWDQWQRLETAVWWFTEGRGGSHLSAAPSCDLPRPCFPPPISLLRC